jgi:peptidoglycan/LPS O-acetylase OafA/YrhL
LKPASLPYRPEIDGLRAVAILPVVLHHAGVPGFGGGFIGVDVFFVISGYLITRIIVAALAGDRFRFAAFYDSAGAVSGPAVFRNRRVAAPYA